MTRRLKEANVSDRFFDWDTLDLCAEELSAALDGFSQVEGALASLALTLWGYTRPEYSTEQEFDALRYAAMSGADLLACLEAIAIRGGVIGMDQALVPMPRE